MPSIDTSSISDSASMFGVSSVEFVGFALRSIGLTLFLEGRILTMSSLRQADWYRIQTLLASAAKLKRWQTGDASFGASSSTSTEGLARNELRWGNLIDESVRGLSAIFSAGSLALEERL